MGKPGKRAVLRYKFNTLYSLCCQFQWFEDSEEIDKLIFHFAENVPLTQLLKQEELINTVEERIQFHKERTKNK